MFYMHFSLPYPCYMPCPSHPPWLGKKFKLWSSSLCNFPQPPVTSSPFGPNILVSTLFSNTISLCSYLNVRDQVLHPYRTTGKIIVLVLILTFRWQMRRQSFWTEWQQALPEFTLLLISSWIKFWFVTVVPKYLNYATLSNHLLTIFMSWFCSAVWWQDSNMHRPIGDVSHLISVPCGLLSHS
jgi:hypothetical protein